MQAKTVARTPNDPLLPGLRDLQRDIDGCIQAARAKQPQMHERFGTFELTVGIAKLEEAKIWLDQVVYRLGYKGSHE